MILWRLTKGLYFCSQSRKEKKETMNFCFFSKLIFSGFLLVIFVFYFGAPSWYKFQAQEVMNNRRTLDNEDSVTPAVTICAMHPESARGWKYGKSISQIQKVENDLDISKIRHLVQSNTDLTNHCNHADAVVDCIIDST